jgi:hypothetical protein
VKCFWTHWPTVDTYLVAESAIATDFCMQTADFGQLIQTMS